MARTRPSHVRALPVLATLLLAACGDARLKELTEYIPRDSALKVLAADGSGEHVYRESQYLVNGRMYRVAFYTPTDRRIEADTAGGGEALQDRELTPLVFENDTLTGWGWKHWQQVAASIKLPVEAPR